MKKNLLILTVTTGLTLGMASCSETCPPPGDPVNLTPAKPIVLKSEFDAKTKSIRSFAIDIFKETVIESNGENIFISPYSINTTLGMLWNGAAGETEAELRTVLGNGSYTKEQINEYAKTLTDALLRVDPSTQLNIANSIWADNSTPFKSSFCEANATWYNAEIRNVDFSRQETYSEIDDWCLRNTNNRIDKITEGMSTDTKFALINAIYFKAKWKNKFKKENTADKAFYNHDGTYSIVPMMNQKEDHLYADDDSDWKMLRLPYGNKAFSMLILMPYDYEPLDEKLATLTAAKYYDLLGSMDTYDVNVMLPKFTASYSYELDKSILPAMGLTQVFDPSTADLSEMCYVSMYVDMVIHKTFVEVNEEGTEAAAVTLAPGMDGSPPPGTPIEFFVTRPFVYSIIENSTGTILFMGRVNSF